MLIDPLARGFFNTMEGFIITMVIEAIVCFICLKLVFRDDRELAPYLARLPLGYFGVFVLDEALGLNSAVQGYIGYDLYSMQQADNIIGAAAIFAGFALAFVAAVTDKPKPPGKPPVQREFIKRDYPQIEAQDTPRLDPPPIRALPSKVYLQIPIPQERKE